MVIALGKPTTCYFSRRVPRNPKDTIVYAHGVDEFGKRLLGALYLSRHSVFTDADHCYRGFVEFGG